MKDADYIYAVACIRTKEKNLLKDSDIQTISGLSSESAVITYLTERGWGTHDTKDAEQLLSMEEAKTGQVLTELAGLFRNLRFRKALEAHAGEAELLSLIRELDK